MASTLPPKRQMLAECEFILALKTDHTLKRKGEKVLQANGTREKAGVTISTSNKIHVKLKLIRINKKDTSLNKGNN